MAFTIYAQAQESWDFYLDFPNAIYDAGKVDAALLKASDVTLLLEHLSQTWGNGASLMLFDIARWQPNAVLGAEEKFHSSFGLAMSSGTAVGFRETTLGILARARYELRSSCITSGCDGSKDTSSPISLQDIRRLLQKRTRYDDRVQGAYFAYMRWLDARTDRSSIEQILAEQASRPEPDLRIAANMAREMVRVGALTEVSRDVSAGLALARIRYFGALQTPHLTHAARLSMERWIDATSANRRTH